MYVCLFCILFFRPERSLASDGRDGHGFVCRLHSIRPPSQSQSLHITTHRSSNLRRILGVFLIVHFQCKRHGQSKLRHQHNLPIQFNYSVVGSHAARRQPSRISC